MSKKGFTLVELLAVLVLLSLIMIVAFPSILGAFKSTDTKVNENTKELLKANAKSYVNDNPGLQKASGSVCISSLISHGYTQFPIANVDKDKSEEIKSNWKITYQCQNGKCTNFEVIENGDVCE